MSYDDSLLTTSALFRVRFALQDVDTTNEMLSDNEINYLLVKNLDDEPATIVEAAKKILTMLTSFSRARESQVEIYGDQHYKQWKDHLSTLIEDVLSTTGRTLGGRIIIGGVSKTEVNRVKKDLDSHSPYGVGINTFFDEQYR